MRKASQNESLHFYYPARRCGHPFQHCRKCWAKGGYSNAILALWWGLPGMLCWASEHFLLTIPHVIKPAKAAQDTNGNLNSSPGDMIIGSAPTLGAPAWAAEGAVLTQLEQAGKALTHINGYKLFYFRVNHKLSLNALSRATGLEPHTSAASSKRLAERKGSLDPSLWFAASDRNVINLLEDALDAHGRLEAGKPDDFLTQYMMFYDKRTSVRAPDQKRRT